MLALLRGDVADTPTDVLLQVLLAVDPLDDQLGRVATDAGLDDPQAPIGLLSLLDQGPAQFGILHLLPLVLFAPGRDRPPGRRGVVKVPVLEGEGEPRPAGPALGKEGKPFLRHPSIHAMGLRWTSALERAMVTTL